MKWINIISVFLTKSLGCTYHASGFPNNHSNELLANRSLNPGHPYIQQAVLHDDQ